MAPVIVPADSESRTPLGTLKVLVSLLMKQFDHSGFSFAEIAREPDSQTRYLRFGRCVLPSGCGFHCCGQARIGLACQALGAQEIAVLDQIAPTLPIARAVFRLSWNRLNP